MIAGLDIIKILDFTPGVVDMKEDVGRLSPLKRHYVNQVKENDFGVDAIYFSGEFPSVYFKAVPDFQEPVLKELLDVQRKIWNQGKVPFLYAESPVEIRIYNCYEKPRHLTKDSGDLELVQASKRVAEELNVLKQVFGKISIETGNFWKEKGYPDKVRNETRVDRSLIDSLKQTRRILYNQGKGLPKEVIHDLLLRSLFLLYLEDRGATDAKLYEGRKGYFEVLDDIDVTYRVYEKLEQSFNGNLSPVTPTERAIVTNDHLTEIKNCFWSGHTLFFGWRFFDFKIIPIQLISEIYEDFLSEEIGEEQKNAAGAFYTPHPLAEFVLNEALPHASVDHINYNVKVLDPTCGSGIFLVETLNRLIDRWLLANPGKRFSFEIAKQIVLDNIFGIEKKRAAIKVAAFSLYLAMIDRLEPKTLWQAVTFPYLIYDPTSEDADKQGKNLFCMSSLESGPFEDIDFDLLVGNPPFGGRKVEKDVRAYLENQRFGNETVEAFLHRAVQLCPNGKIVLISTSKVLFNTGSKHQNFRRFLFNDCYVEKVYNFSILRRVPQSRGRNLFASTVRPISIFLYSAQVPVQPSDKLMYCAPTTAIKNRIIDGIAIDPTDVKYLPREECQKPDTKVWKVGMWGTERDFSLLKYLQSKQTLGKFFKNKGWDKKNMGVGLEVPGKTKDIEIQNFPHIAANKISRYYSAENKTEKIGDISFRRLGAKNAYKSPHVLIKEGQTNKRFCASFLDFNCSFKKVVFGIHAPDDGDELKLLVAYLNSSLASYLMFLNASNWGIERETVKSNEFLEIPDLFSYLLDNVKKEIVSYIDEIIAVRKKEFSEIFFNAEQQIYVWEQKIEAAFLEGLNLSETDKILIEDLLNYQVDSFQSEQKSKAYKPCKLDDSRAYAHYLCKTINEFLKYTPETSVWASVFGIHERTPLNVVILHLNQEQKAGTIQELQSDEINQVLKELEQYTYREHSESIYYRKFFRYYNDDVVYLVKPNEKRFWSRSMGLNDADEITLEILTVEHER